MKKIGRSGDRVIGKISGNEYILLPLARRYEAQHFNYPITVYIRWLVVQDFHQHFVR
jgi:hypothetical protein